MKFAISFLALAVLAQVSLNTARPYGYNQSRAAALSEVAAPTDPHAQHAQPSTVGSTCGCGDNCKCGINGPSSNCGCKTGGCQCGAHESITEAPTTPPKSVCGCGANCKCGANGKSANCGCQSPCGCGKPEKVKSINERLQALFARYSQKPAY